MTSAAKLPESHTAPPPQHCQLPSHVAEKSDPIVPAMPSSPLSDNSCPWLRNSLHHNVKLSKQGAANQKPRCWSQYNLAKRRN